MSTCPDLPPHPPGTLTIYSCHHCTHLTSTSTRRPPAHLPCPRCHHDLATCATTHRNSPHHCLSTDVYHRWICWSCGRRNAAEDLWCGAGSNVNSTGRTGWCGYERRNGGCVWLPRLAMEWAWMNAGPEVEKRVRGMVKFVERCFEVDLV
ncbi:hypothetical protein EX30DRAFT_397353 [Ascodesmis nigricans]|uniref:RanBP2-type domain-containing protein n=1 Tax=Ascodesmis nigricans TaxID=341454 RepID=A0A4S2MRW1_9PEZI|nr:hypothetical protein EX30DRAFT_397353 [Ascodesmis nigricans]